MSILLLMTLACQTLVCEPVRVEWKEGAMEWEWGGEVADIVWTEAYALYLALKFCSV